MVALAQSRTPFIIRHGYEQDALVLYDSHLPLHLLVGSHLRNIRRHSEFPLPFQNRIDDPVVTAQYPYMVRAAGT